MRQTKKYLPWANAGGPNECKHGYAAGIPCPDCDEIAKAEQPPSGEQPAKVEFGEGLPPARKVAIVTNAAGHKEVEKIVNQLHSALGLLRECGQSPYLLSNLRERIKAAVTGE